MLIALAGKVASCQERLDEQAVGNALYGLQVPPPPPPVPSYLFLSPLLFSPSLPISPSLLFSPLLCLLLLLCVKSKQLLVAYLVI